MSSKNFALSSINKDHLEDLQNYLNQITIAAINIADGSTFGDNVITSHQVDHMSKVLIPAEAVQNDQEHITSSSNNVGSIAPLF